MKIKLKEISRKYSESFTTHGLANVFHGNSRMERFCWAIIIIFAFAFTAYLSREVVTAVAEHKLVNDYSIKEVDSLPLPKVIICMRTSILPRNEVKFSWETMNCDLKKKSKKKSKMCKRIVKRYKAKGLSSLQMINKSISRRASFYIPTETTYHSRGIRVCEILNSDGEWKQILDSKRNSVNVPLRGGVLRLWFQAPDEIANPYDMPERNAIIINYGDIVEYKLKVKTVVKVDCNHDDYAEAASPFSGRYTYLKCKNTCHVRFYMKKCRFLPSEYQKLVKRSWLQQFNLSHDAKRNAECLAKHHTSKGDRMLCYEDCKQDCAKKMYEVDVQTRRTNTNETKLKIYFPALLEETITERHLATWQEAFGLLGGTLGLLTGTSVLSVIEVLIFTVACVLYKCL